MYSRALKFLFGLSLIVSSAYANEGGGHEAPAKEEPKAEEHGGGGGHGEGAPKKKEIKKSEDSFAVVQARVLGLEAKVRSSEEEIKKLIKEKQHTTDDKKLNEIIKQMMALHHEMEKNAKEYDQQRALLNYRYPEKGQTEGRKYERLEVKSIEEMEGQMSLKSSIKKTLSRVRSAYSSSQQGKPPGEAADKKTESPSLIDPVILKK